MNNDPNVTINVDQDKVKKAFGSFFKGFFWLIIVIGIALYFLSSTYQVGPSEVAIIKTFGKYSSTVGPGINYHLPPPFQTHVIVDVKTIKKLEIGFRSQTEEMGKGQYTEIPEESVLLTGDENILNMQVVVQYRIVDPIKLAFNVTDEKNLVSYSVQSAIREKFAMSNIDESLTLKRDTIAYESLLMSQKILDNYNSGIKIDNVLLQAVTPPKTVVEAFDDVNNAKQDKEKSINEARKYSNDVIPKAEGEAQKIIKEAEGYSFEKVEIAKGESQRFIDVYNEYKLSKEITKRRMLLESIKAMLENSKMKIINQKDGTINLLDLKSLGGSK